MSIGTSVKAARAGTVLQVDESHFDGQIDGAAVNVGDLVQQGSLIGFSGNTGNTANKPHLHFSVQQCDPVARGTEACPTLPVTFRNTDPNPNGLQAGRAYEAKPF